MTEQQSQTAEADVWDRLRHRIEEMCSADRSQADPAALAKKLANRSKVLRGRIGKAEPLGPQISFLAFSAGKQRYGIPLSDIIEVQPLIEYTPVPGAPRFIPGVIHWRGSIVSLIDLIELFGILESGLLDEHACLIVEAAGRRLGILAAELEKLCVVPLAQVKPAPELPIEVPSDWFVGVYDENRLILRTEQMLQDERLTNWRDK